MYSYVTFTLKFWPKISPEYWIFLIWFEKQKEYKEKKGFYSKISGTMRVVKK